MPDMTRIGITMGDPNGIGPEVIAKSLRDLERSGELNFEPVIYGSEQVIRKSCELNGYEIRTPLINIEGFPVNELTPGKVSSKAGKISIKSIEKAVKDAVAGNLDAVVTAPISKESIHMSGSAYPGHTEMLKDLTNAHHAVMMFDGGPFRVALVTIHIPLSEVPVRITGESVFNTIQVCRNDLVNRFGITNPKLAVCGLNPHAGEAGAFGNEEIEHIAPAVRNAADKGIDVTGPYPADTLFYHAMKGKWDMIIAMYHDQGLIPFKMLAFDKGVNVTLGLPIIRTSPDHGTAYDIAWKGDADPASMTEAIKLAVKLADRSRAADKI